MKIALTNAFLPSEQQHGVPFQVHQLANGLCKRGHDVTVFSFSPAPADAQYVCHQYPRPSVPKGFWPFFMAYHLATTDFSAFDVINCHGDNFLLRSATPVVRTFSGTARSELRFAKTLRRRLFFMVLVPLEYLGAKLADHVVGISETTRESMQAVKTIIHCGVDVSAFHPGPKTENPTLLFVGTEGGRKRGAWLAEMFKSQVLPAVPNAELRMVSERTGVEPGIRRYGRVSSETLAELYRSSWAFCLPSTYEGFGVPFIEAMAAGTAAIGTAPNPGAREVLGDGAYGAFVDDADLAGELVAMLSDTALRAQMERQGLERSRQFAWEETAARYEALFVSVIAVRGVHSGTPMIDKVRT
jgi:phosphatidylinositol alpha-mannosyltransferase